MLDNQQENILPSTKILSGISLFFIFYISNCYHAVVPLLPYGEHRHPNCIYRYTILPLYIIIIIIIIITYQTALIILLGPIIDLSSSSSITYYLINEQECFIRFKSTNCEFIERLQKLHLHCFIKFVSYC
jgi:hypothetical protein